MCSGTRRIQREGGRGVAPDFTRVMHARVHEMA